MEEDSIDKDYPGEVEYFWGTIDFSDREGMWGETIDHWEIVEQQYLRVVCVCCYGCREDLRLESSKNSCLCCGGRGFLEYDLNEDIRESVIDNSSNWNRVEYHLSLNPKNKLEDFPEKYDYDPNRKWDKERDYHEILSRAKEVITKAGFTDPQDIWERETGLDFGEEMDKTLTRLFDDLDKGESKGEYTIGVDF